LRDELEVLARWRRSREPDNFLAQHPSEFPTIEILKSPHSSHAALAA